MQTLCLGPSKIDQAAAFLREGQIVAFPTETVYGLGSPIYDIEALRKIFQAKGRPLDNPLIVHIADIEQLQEVAVDIPEAAAPLCEQFWPGPLTLVLKRHPHVPPLVSANLDTIAVRLPSHPLARELIRAARGPLAAPSANLSGKPSSTQASHVLADFNGLIAAVLDGGPCHLGIESTVLSLYNPQDPVILRPGSITRKQLEQVLEVSIRESCKEDKAASPGMKYRHYAPKAPVKLFTDEQELLNYLQNHATKKHILLSRNKMEGIQHLPLSSKELFSSLRLADAERCEEVLIYCDAEILQQEGLMNRILKASSKE